MDSELEKGHLSSDSPVKGRPRDILVGFRPYFESFRIVIFKTYNL